MKHLIAEKRERFVEHKSSLGEAYRLDNFYLTRSLVAVEPRRPPKTNVDTETAFRHDHCMTRVRIQK